jgi:hypothetical protein
VAVAAGPPIGVLASLGADDLGDVLLHRTGQHAEPGPDRERHRALAGGADELSERLLHARRQQLLLPVRARAGRYGVLHGGSPSIMADHSEGSQRERTEEEVRRLHVLRAMGLTKVETRRKDRASRPSTPWSGLFLK